MNPTTPRLSRDWCGYTHIHYIEVKSWELLYVVTKVVLAGKNWPFFLWKSCLIFPSHSKPILYSFEKLNCGGLFLRHFTLEEKTHFSRQNFCLEHELFYAYFSNFFCVYFEVFPIFHSSTFTVTKVAQIISHLEIVSKNIGSTLMQCRSWIWSYFLGFSWIGPILKNTTPIMIKK